YDVKGLIIAAARDDNPVFVVMNKQSLALRGEVPEGPYEVPLGKANVVRGGDNFTIVAVSRMVHEALKAADDLKQYGLNTEVIDVRS
ncbi:MAG: alpha-ketoacid dehydrogenase subunit beta, partial [Desulfuromonadales bacterium]|nr:alpha-ketoacid dehydrogenase subunit beta [Desulfuromonadales bacterium]